MALIVMGCEPNSGGKWEQPVIPVAFSLHQMKNKRILKRLGFDDCDCDCDPKENPKEDNL